MLKKILLLILLFTTISCTTIIDNKYNKNQEVKEPYESIDVEEIIEEQEDKLIVAILLPLSGSAEKVGNAMLQSAELALFNSTIDNIVLMPYDTKGTAFGAVDAINSAIRDGAGLILGPLFTQSTKAILDIAEANNLLVLSFSDNQALLDQNNPNLYLMGLTPQQEIYSIKE